MATYEQTLSEQGICRGSAHEMEWEDEFSHEFEDEGEWGDILGGIAKGIGGLFGEGEDEFVHELSHEITHEGEAEDEAFFSKLADIASRGVSSPALQNLARRAAQSALQSGAPTRALDTVLSVLSEAELEAELVHELSHEYAHEYHEYEDEDELNPVRKVYLDAMMEHLAHAAAEAETEAEAAAFIAPLASLAVKALPKVLKHAPKVMQTVTKAVPHLAKAARGVAKTLRQNPTTSPMTRILPTAIKRSAATLAKHAAAGHHVTPGHARRAVAHHSARIIRNPRQAVNIYRRARALDRNYHRLRPARLGAIARFRRPHYAYGGGTYRYPGARPPQPVYTGHRPVPQRPGYAAAPGAPAPGYAPVHGYAGGDAPGYSYWTDYAPGGGMPVPGYVGGRHCQCTCRPY